MQAACLQENAAQAMSLLGRSIYSRGNDRMAHHVLITAENSFMKFTASSGLTHITATVSSMIEEPGRVTLPGRMFHDYVNTLPADRLDFATEADNPLALKINCGQREWSRILGAAPQFFPPFPEVAEHYQPAIDPEVSRTPCAAPCSPPPRRKPGRSWPPSAWPSAPKDFAPPPPTGFRLSVRRCPLETAPPEEFQLLIPAKDPEEAARLAQQQNNPLVIVADADLKRVEFRTDPTKLVSQLFNGQLPNYAELNLQEWTARTTF